MDSTDGAPGWDAALSRNHTAAASPGSPVRAGYTATVPPRSRDPFRPGEGRLPPHLAGREREQAIFRKFLDDLRAGDPAPSSVVLYGPRGNGKTALLRWLSAEVAALNERREAEATAIETLWFTPGEIATVEGLVAEVASRSWLEKLGVTKLGLPGMVEVTRQAGGSAPARMVAQAFSERAREKPWILLLDEAHNLDGEVGNALLNAAQKVGGEAPFLLVLAGTPDLRRRLRRMSASFWPRARQMPIGRLSAASARDAVRIPLRQDQIGIAQDALDQIVVESRRYPFFLQLWGSSVWTVGNARRGPRRTVGLADVRSHTPEFVQTANLYYLERYEELTERRLLAAAWAVADAFGAGPAPRGAAESLPEEGMEAAVARGLGSDGAERVREVTESLFHLGYIWRSGGEPDWEAGIPSLMDYVWERVPSSRRPVRPSAAARA